MLQQNPEHPVRAGKYWALCQLVLVESFETHLTLCQMRFCLLSNQGDPIKEVGQIPEAISNSF